MKTTARNGTHGIERQFSPETELLLKQRLKRYKRRARRPSMGDVAGDLSDWTGIERWFPKAALPRSKPVFTRRILDTWILGDTSHSSKRSTTPRGLRLTVIAEFLIEKKYLLEFELISDDEGFGLSNALNAHLGDPKEADFPTIEGRYEAYTDDEESLILHRLEIFRDTENNTLLFEYAFVQAFARHGDTRANLQDRINTDINFIRRNTWKGWAIRVRENQALALLRNQLNYLDRPQVWTWSFEYLYGTYFSALNFGDISVPLLSASDAVEGTHQQPVMKRLTYGNDISYHFRRRGGYDLSIIQTIMEKSKKTELSKLDRDFLRAAHQGNPDRMNEALANGANVNAIDPATGLTALMDAAAGGVTGIINILIDRPDLDPTIADHKGRLASDVVTFTIGDFDLVDRLIDIEVSYDERRAPQP